MKKLLYSRYMKLAAIAAFVIMFCIMGSAVCNLWNSENNQSDELRNAQRNLNLPVQDILYAIDYSTEDEANAGELPAAADNQTQEFKTNLEKALSLYEDKVDYYIELSDPELKLFNNDKLTEYRDRQYYYIMERHNDTSNCSTNLSVFFPARIKKARVYIALKDDYAHEQSAAITDWHRQAYDEFLAKLLRCSYIVLLIFIYLLIVCGRTHSGKKRYESKIDLWYQEIPIALMIMTLLAAGLFFTIGVKFRDAFDLQRHGTLISSLLCGLALLLLLSPVRNLKNGTFAQRSILCRGFKKLWNICKNGARELKGLLGRKSGAILAALLAGYAVMICLFNIMGAAVGFLAVCVIIGTRSRELDEIKHGVKQIKMGDFSHKIPECRSEDYSKLAQDINEISKGFSAAVDEQIKSERLKTELITNVSHDLKTPLTSIINYTKLLEGLELTPEEARDYVKIISKKGESLKRLTADLFEISKVQSGNESIRLEKLDTALLINQSMGELEGEFKESGLVLNVKLEEKLYITADGNKMSRVIGNLLSNIIKYTMRNTRVFISSSRIEGKAVMEFKNISAFPLDFDTDEITERFVRGDRSRSMEGNGLGLAIAKSYVEVCGGTLRVTADGDMFKVSITFNIAL